MRSFEHWKLEDAKARLSEVVRLAKSQGPQVVTIRGEEAAVVVSAEEFAGMLPHPAGRVPLVTFLQSLSLGDFSREHDPGRELKF